MFDYAKKAHERGLKVIIAGAGGAAERAGADKEAAPAPAQGLPDLAGEDQTADPCAETADCADLHESRTNSVQLVHGHQQQLPARANRKAGRQL